MTHFHVIFYVTRTSNSLDPQMIGRCTLGASTCFSRHDYISGAVSICVLAVDYTCVLDVLQNFRLRCPAKYASYLLYVTARCTAYCMQRSVHFKCAISVLNSSLYSKLHTQNALFAAWPHILPHIENE
jgi:hypothetical protein